MEIVTMAEAHLDALAQLEQQCFFRPWSRTALAEELDNPAAVFLTAVDGEKVLGYAGMHCVLDECYLDNVAVFPQYRRQGVAKALLAALEGEARRGNALFLTLEVRASNRQAISLYSKTGFREEGRRKAFYSAPTEDALILTKRF